MSRFLFSDSKSVQQRDLSNLQADQTAVFAMAQAAVNVELFTIPLYMTSLYSIYGMHQITGNGSDFYQGRLWPGAGTTHGTPDSLSSNQDAFNKVFSVFIAEMLHLQLASNIAKALGYDPVFTSNVLQNNDHSWKCYGENVTVIPHILDLKDTLPNSQFHNLKVNLGPLDADQILLFLAIEETAADAQKNVDPEIWKSKYSPTVPFQGWTAAKTELDLPLFGTIGNMYYCLWEYLSIQYTDGSTLWSRMFKPGAIQQDKFNTGTGMKAQYPRMDVQIDATDPDTALSQVIDMIDGITDQGEGSGVVTAIRQRLQAISPIAIEPLTAVETKYQPDAYNVAYDYPSFSDTGAQLPSADASARTGANGELDHWEVFAAVQKIIEKPDFMTWVEWHNTHESWTAADLISDKTDYETNRKNYPKLPAAEDIAGALNNLNPCDPSKKKATHKLLSQVATGSIAGMTTVLDKYWQKKDAQFPMPAMGGTADRISICWAILGEAPDLSLAAPPTNDTTILYHACQGLALDPNTPTQEWGCAAPSIYHTCIGSNDCRSQGGCGFVQSTTGGGSCGHSQCGSGAKAARRKLGAVGIGGCTPPTYSAPADNKCGSFGGCAVPISASQMYPQPKGLMLYYDYVQDPNTQHWSSKQLDHQYPYKEGELVHDVAWEAYTTVLKERGQTPPEKPEPNDIRLAFPPST